MINRILLAGGGTGGHVYPLVAVAEELNRLADQSGGAVKLRFIGDGAILKEEADKLGVNFRRVISPKWRRYFSLQNFLGILQFPIGFLQSLFYVWLFMPDTVFIKGGYGSFLPALAARIMLVPVAVHESDAVPGRTNLFFGRRAGKVFVAFQSAAGYFKSERTQVVGNPIRAAVLTQIDQSQARSAFSLDPAKPTVLITGASQGAKTLNDVLMLSVVELVKSFQVIHQTGPANFDEVNSQLLAIVKEGQSGYGQTVAGNYRLYPMFDAGQLALALSAADVVISRAGSSIFEIAAWAKPAIVVPLKHSASNHQLANAREFAKFGAVIIEQDNLTPHILINEIKEAYQNRQARGERIKAFAKTDAAAIIARELLNFS